MCSLTCHTTANYRDACKHDNQAQGCCRLLQTNSGATIFPTGLRQNVTAVMLQLLNQGTKLSNLSPAAFETAGTVTT